MKKEYEDADPTGDGSRVVEMVSACPACNSGYQEAARRHADYWLDKADEDAPPFIFYAQKPKQIPILDVESLEPLDLRIIRQEDL